MSRNMAFCSILLVPVCLASLVAPARAQHFNKVKGTVTSASAGRNEVFCIRCRCQRLSLFGEFESLHQDRQNNACRHRRGRRHLSQTDEVWGITPAATYSASTSVLKTFKPIPGILSRSPSASATRTAVNPYEVWGVNSADDIFRYNYCTKEFVQATGLLTQVATGGGDVWGLNSTGHIFHFNFGSQTFVAVSGALTQIAVGVNDVWGVNISNNVFRYNPSANTFNSVGGNTSQVAAGGDGVWLVDTSSHIFRFRSERGTVCRGSGILKSITVGSGAGVFGVNPSDAASLSNGHRGRTYKARVVRLPDSAA